LLETTRAFALAKLAESGEANAIGRRHAAWYRDMAEASPNYPSDPREYEIDNLRAALTWAFGPEGDRGIAVPLAVGSAAILLGMSLVIECHTWMQMALDAIDPADRETRREMVLQAALGLSLMYMGDTSNGGHAALTRAKELAESLGDFDYLLRILAGQHNLYLRLEDHQSGLAVARRSVAIAEGMHDPAAATTANCILGASLLSLGAYDEALIYARRSQRLAVTVRQRADIVARSGIDHSIWADCIVAHVFWQQGLLDQAAQTSHVALSVAEAAGHPVSLCFALVWCGCTVALGRGDLVTAERSTVRLNDTAERLGFSAYYACSLGFAGQLAARRGDPAHAERLLRDSLDRLRRLRYEIFYTIFLADLAEVLAALGNPDAGLVAIDEVLARNERNGGTCLLPEALRIKGEILLLSHLADVVAAEEHFRHSLDLARRQGAVSSQLRSAMSLGRLRHAQGHVHEAYDLLQSAFARFTEGFTAADLQCARRLLQQWAPGRGRQHTN
jgi:tetratricopeptide (TPR) repeat protein